VTGRNPSLLHLHRIQVSSINNVEMRNAYKMLVGKRERKRLHGRPRHKYEENIRMDLKEIGWIGFLWLRIGTSCGLL
jgi:hypothetical protein